MDGLGPSPTDLKSTRDQQIGGTLGSRRLANDSLAPPRRYFEASALKGRRAPNCAPTRSPAARPGGRERAPRYAARPAAARDLPADCGLSQLWAPEKKPLAEKRADRGRRRRSSPDRWGRRLKGSPA